MILTFYMNLYFDRTKPKNYNIYYKFRNKKKSQHKIKILLIIKQKRVNTNHKKN